MVVPNPQANQTLATVIATAMPGMPEAGVLVHLRQYVQNYLMQNNLVVPPDGGDLGIIEEPGVDNQRQYRFVCTTVCGRKFYFFAMSDRQDNVIQPAAHMELDADNNPIIYEVPVGADAAEDAVA